jgi:NADH-quinone oxidoreductase subunit G
MMALAVRQAVIRTAAEEASNQLGLPVWQDAAIKEIVQDDKGFLANITVSHSPLDDIAAHANHIPPDDIARLGFSIAHELNSSLPALPGDNNELIGKAKDIAIALQKAKRPVIISGISCYNESVIKAAFDIAASLNTAERKAGISYVLPECNSMGLAMMNPPSFNDAATRLRREKGNTVLIVENDLYRHIPQSVVDTFLKTLINLSYSIRYTIVLQKKQMCLFLVQHLQKAMEH